MLQTKRNLLYEYFRISIDEEHQLTSLPLLLQNYVPNMDHLPYLFYKIAFATDFTTEKTCLRQMFEHISSFYTLHRPTPQFKANSYYLADSDLPFNYYKTAEITDEWHWDAIVVNQKLAQYKLSIQHTILPAMKNAHFKPREVKHKWIKNICVCIASLPDLYKVFERC